MAPIPSCFRRLRFPAIVLIAMVAVATAQGPDEAVRHARNLADQGQIPEAIELLEKQVSEDKDDVKARHFLGMLLDFDGRPDEAITVWEQGISKDRPEVMLLIAVGQIRERQGNDGPTITYKRGTVTASPNKDKEASARYKQEHLEMAAKAYEAAIEAKDDSPELALHLASVYVRLKNFAAATTLLEAQVQQNPKDVKLALELAHTHQAAGKQDAAVAAYQDVLMLNPREAQAYQALAESYAASGDQAKADESSRQAHFYGWLPSFCTIEFSDANYATVEKLTGGAKAAGKQPRRARGPERDKLVDDLISDGSATALELLAAICWHHEDHGPVEDKAFKAIESHPEEGVPILKSLLLNAQSTCTAKSASHTLARLKDPQVYELIVRLLPGDTRSFFDMDSAGALEELGDPRAVGPLIKMSGFSVRQDLSKDDGMMTEQGRLMARIRATLALGAFDTPKSRHALSDGLKNPQLALACSAALYRLTKADERFQELETGLAQEDGVIGFLVAQEISRVGDDRSKPLADKWKARQTEKRKKGSPEAGRDTEP